MLHKASGCGYPGLRSSALRTILNYPYLSVSNPETSIRRVFVIWHQLCVRMITRDHGRR